MGEGEVSFISRLLNHKIWKSIPSTPVDHSGDQDEKERSSERRSRRYNQMSTHPPTPSQQEHEQQSPPQITTTPPHASHRSEERDLQINYGLLLLHHGKCESVRGTLTINHQTARNVSDQRDGNTARRQAGRHHHHHHHHHRHHAPTTTAGQATTTATATHTHTNAEDAAEVSRRPAHSNCK